MDIILENPQFRLVIGSDCAAKSLVHKKTGRECLDPEEKVALFSVTQPRPFNNEVKLAYPNKRTVFQANRVRMEGDRLTLETPVEVRQELYLPGETLQELPVDRRRYICTDLPEDKVRAMLLRAAVTGTESGKE